VQRDRNEFDSPNDDETVRRELIVFIISAEHRFYIRHARNNLRVPQVNQPNKVSFTKKNSLILLSFNFLQKFFSTFNDIYYFVHYLKCHQFSVKFNRLLQASGI
jgi:hypothetical protein